MTSFRWRIREAPPSARNPRGTPETWVDADYAPAEAAFMRRLVASIDGPRHPAVSEVDLLHEMKVLFDATIEISDETAMGRNPVPFGDWPSRVIWVTLTYDEQAAAYAEGKRIHDHHQRNNTDHVDGMKHRDRNLDIWTAETEYAAAAALGIPRPTHASAAENRVEGDLGYGIGVRATTHAGGRLRFTQRDKQGHIQILVRGEQSPYEVAGWWPVELGKQVPLSELQPGRPQHWVTQDRIYGMNELARMKDMLPL